MKDISSLDIVEFLGLDKSLSPAEMDELMSFLTKEIWYRVLNEKLPKVLGEKKFKELVAESDEDDSLDVILSRAKKKAKGVDLDKLISNSINEVKREYVIAYLEELYKSTEDEKKKKLIKEKLELWKE